ncbi:MAG: ethanolamine ammonia-lyase subunit EutC [Hyphomicrobiales bacterium]|nr:MAG: ethanolamine ammonia-lyase subunit EutC [Hyphomicrobiales bacterium]
MTDLRDPWRTLSERTPARIALGRAGASLPTGEVLRFSLAHAQARDAVHAPLALEELKKGVEEVFGPALVVESQAVDRSLYLRRPDLGRQLAEPGRQMLRSARTDGADLAIVIGDGLSARAVNEHAVSLLSALKPRLDALQLNLATPVIALGARVALGDEIGALLGARAVAMLIGERPGLSSPDSLGVYFTYAPQTGRTDAERNCISNIRREGLAYDPAAFKLAWIVREALRRELSGVDLKDDSDKLLEAGNAPPVLLPER